MPAHLFDPTREDDLADCVKCNCGEGTLPTECPEVKVGYDDQQLIYTGKLDFINGEWKQK